jgi:hypothetical protein
MKTTTRKEEYHFRIIGLEQSLVDLLEKELRPAGFTKKIYNDTKNYTISFPITQATNQKGIADFLSVNKIPDSKYGFFASLTTTKDIDGLEFPDFVSRFHKLVGGNIDVSVLYSGQ